LTVDVSSRTGRRRRRRRRRVRSLTDFFLLFSLEVKVTSLHILWNLLK
jgi:hypothetical protein